jgi:hypothetical protein
MHSAKQWPPTIKAQNPCFDRDVDTFRRFSRYQSSVVV